MADRYEAPLPKPTPDTQLYWKALRGHELHIQRCGDCNEAYFYPRSVCPHCLSGNVAWFRASGRGRLHTFTIVYAAGPKPPLPTPYIIAVVELEEGPRMLTNLVGVDPDPAKLSCDLPVEIEFADVTDECTLPHFRLAGGE
ncbi:MAG: Zn-ribbon domain-containing OB-fold protein [Candidatus Binatia bacterium]|nr:Zn-ribbon domain-containing OB-fold protein [Candidatus Binatia bacterium]